MSGIESGVKWFNTVFYPKAKVYKGRRMEDGVILRLREKDVCLFTPWGPRYSWQARGSDILESDKEVEVLKVLQSVHSEIVRNMPCNNFRWFFLGADLYGTRLNGLPEDAVREYFNSLSMWLSRLLPTSEFVLWSRLDLQAERYRDYVRANFDRYANPELLRRTTLTAKAMRRGSDPKAYLIERVSEALLIEELLKPIKVSCVMPEKDAVVDVDLPRLYFVPENLTAPWM